MAFRAKTKLWLETHDAELRHSLRVSLAGLCAFVIAESLELPQGYWAVFTAVLVTQASVGGSVKAALDWLWSTVGGGAYAALIGTLIPKTDLVALGAGLVLALTPLAFLAAVRPTFRFAPVTGVIVILVAPVQHISPMASAGHRLLEICIGGVVGLVVSLMILPARASAILNQSAARVLELFADVLPLLLQFDRGQIQAELTARHDTMLVQLARLTAAVEEAKRERSSFLSNEPDPEPVLRTVQRLRADIIMLGRAMAEPFPDAFHARLAAPLTDAVQTLAEICTEMGRSLVERRPPPDLGKVDQTIAHYAREMLDVRNDKLTLDLTTDVAGRTYAVGFALEQFKGNLKDLAARTAERIRKPAAG